MISKSTTSALRKSTARRNLRARVAAAFLELAGGVSEHEASTRTRDFYRSSGSDWTRNWA